MPVSGKESRKTLRANHSDTSDDLGFQNPYWNYEDIGVFFLTIVLMGSLLRLLVRFHLLSRSTLDNPSVSFQFALIASLSLALFLVLKLRHRRPVLRPLGWIWPSPLYVVVALLARMSLAFGVALYLRVRNQSTPHPHIMELLLLAVLLGPILEESLFRGCLLPLIAQTTGNVVAVIVTGLLFALLHQPAGLGHWVSLTATGLAYGWIRIASGSTAAAAVTHATYNLALFLFTTF